MERAGARAGSAARRPALMSLSLRPVGQVGLPPRTARIWGGAATTGCLAGVPVELPQPGCELS